MVHNTFYSYHQVHWITALVIQTSHKMKSLIMVTMTTYSCQPSRNISVWLTMRIVRVKCDVQGLNLCWFQILLYSFKSSQSQEFVWLHFRYSIKASPFHSQQWPRHTFSSLCQYNIKQMSDENIEIYQLGYYNNLIQYSILQTKIISYMRQPVRKITKETLGVKGLRWNSFFHKVNG